jgi:hypothetical protein
LLLVVLRPVDSVAMPVDADVDSEVTLLLVVLRPVDSEVTLLSVVLRPVDSEATPLVAVLRPVEVELANDCNWLTFTASVAAEPAATFVRRRSLPALPTDTSPSGLVPDNVAVPGLYAAAARLAVVVEPAPKATELAAVALADWPIATDDVPDAAALAPIAVALELVANALAPTASALLNVAILP